MRLAAQLLQLLPLAAGSSGSAGSGSGSGSGSVTVTTLAGGGGPGDERCRTRRAGYQDGPAPQALFNLPSRVQAVTMADGSERLFVLDDHNGCVRSLPLHVAPNATVVRSETACGPASPIAHVGADAQFPNASSRGWRWVDGPQGFFVTPDARSIYILDTYNNKVKVARRSANGSSFGGWETLAGSGVAGSDDGAAAQATFRQPHGLSVAPSTGFAYVGETFASCIRSIELSTGAVRTVAGKCGTGGHRDTALGEACSAARFNHPHKVTVDPRNESIVYVSDVECSDDGLFYLKDTCKPTYGGVAFTGVRKLEMHRNGSCARVSTVAGFFNASAPTTNPIGFADGSTATARFHYVHGVSIKPLAAGEKRGSGSSILYAIDDLNERVRKIDLAAGNVSTLAGTGRQGCKDGPGDIASFNAVGIAVGRDGSVYVADYENHKIRQLTMMKTDDMVAAKTPPMGWNSWATFGCGVNETILRNAADQIHKLGLGKAGYQYGPQLTAARTLFLDHTSPIFARFFAILSLFSPS